METEHVRRRPARWAPTATRRPASRDLLRRLPWPTTHGIEAAPAGLDPGTCGRGPQAFRDRVRGVPRRPARRALRLQWRPTGATWLHRLSRYPAIPAVDNRRGRARCLCVQARGRSPRRPMRRVPRRDDSPCVAIVAGTRRTARNAAALLPHRPNVRRLSHQSARRPVQSPHVIGVRGLPRRRRLQACQSVRPRPGHAVRPQGRARASALPRLPRAARGCGRSPNDGLRTALGEMRSLPRYGEEGIVTRALSWMVGWCLVLLAAVPSTGRAQEPTRSPHGELAEPCASCHGENGWTPVRISRQFDHARWGFTLNGAHATTACRSCHASLDFRGANRTCAGCHADVHRGELGADCARCHSPRGFLDRSAMVRAHQASRFPLNGAHLTTDCESCHTPAAQGRLTFVNRSTECVQCHLASYQGAKSPDHVAGGFPTDCNQCHATSTWPGARFNHATTRFPLTGAHRAVPCQQCHGDGVYRGKNALCVSCHQADYDRTTDPNHRTSQFSTDCGTCHSTTGWDGANFNHSATAFPLTGAHTTVNCQQCHGDGVFAGKSTACVSCHQADYDATTDPSHQAAQFSTDCASCHTTAGWPGATFDHDARFFPIYSGSHRGRWSSCASCHTNSNDFQIFTCLTCHGQSETDSQHRGRSGYRYDSQACYSCHPRGNGG